MIHAVFGGATVDSVARPGLSIMLCLSASVRVVSAAVALAVARGRGRGEDLEKKKQLAFSEAALTLREHATSGCGRKF